MRFDSVVYANKLNNYQTKLEKITNNLKLKEKN